MYANANSSIGGTIMLVFPHPVALLFAFLSHYFVDRIDKVVYPKKYELAIEGTFLVVFLTTVTAISLLNAMNTPLITASLCVLGAIV